LSPEVNITGVVKDKASADPLIGATISIAGSKNVAAVTDIDGRFSLTVPPGKDIEISYIGYKPLVTKPQGGVYYLESQTNALGEVVVTAQESQSLSSASVIGRRAMDHLQPSSFGDLLELIPGGRSQDPHLSTPNTIKLREAGDGTQGLDYAPCTKSSALARRQYMVLVARRSLPYARNITFR